MKHLIYLFLVTLLLASCGNGENVKLSSGLKPIDSVSYAIGVFEAYSSLDHIKGSGKHLDGIDYDYLIAGFKTILKDNDSIKDYTMQWASDVINRYFTQKVKEETEQAKKDGEAFLEKNKKNDGVKVLPSGLQYQVIANGTGISPEISDTVYVVYTGTEIDGTVFDSSREDTARMPLARMIPGWQEGLPLMQEGAKYKFFIPSSLAYGESGRFASKTLIFDVELIRVGKGPKAKEKK
jgi:FKBP-type peptidyl-prolyl cis-trans isomerase